MSNALAIAAVTATLRSILLKALNNNDPDIPPNSDVTVQPPDKAHEDQQRTHFVNLFLYQVLPNATWRNMDIPQRVKSGETGMPPLALNLYYMLTAYSKDDNIDSPATPTSSHRLLGHAMSALYDNAILFPGDIAQALPKSGLQDQVERVRITLQPLTVEEIFRLWSGFQSQYRISVAYEVSVVLIDSTQPTKTPLPVLTRGKNDRGAAVQPDPLPFPTIFTIRLEDQKPRPRRGPVATPDDPNIPQQPIALLGNTLVVSGRHLDGDNVTVLLMLQRLSQPIKIDIPPEARTSQEVKFKLPPLPGATTFPAALAFPAGLDATTFPDGLALTTFPAGFYTVAIVVTHVIHQAGLPDQIQTQTTNQLSFALAPQITTPIPDGTRDNSNNVSVTLSFSPVVFPWQRVALLLGQQEFLAPSHSTQTDTLTFNLGNVPKGEYFVRLRVDGVDSLPFNPAVSPPKFDESQKVTIA
jgi:hypothetical protein